MSKRQMAKKAASAKGKQPATDPKDEVVDPAKEAELAKPELSARYYLRPLLREVDVRAPVRTSLDLTVIACAVVSFQGGEGGSARTEVTLGNQKFHPSGDSLRGCEPL
eukprot:8972725-Pyramimonas_sp.AAC.2